MLQKNDYAFTDDMRSDLRRYLNGEPSLGHYPANLEFNQAQDADQQSRPDDHYYQEQGQEPPPTRKRRWWNNWEANVMLAALAGILVILALCPVW